MKKRSRNIILYILIVLMAFSITTFVACGKKTNNTVEYNVTFMVEGENYGSIQKVTKGKRIVEPETPTFSNETYVFSGWYTSEQFEESTKWNFSTGIVTKDLTLFAGYNIINEYVTSIAMADEACTSKIVWVQKTASNTSDYEIKITDLNNITLSLTGTIDFDENLHKVTFTPSEIPQGGTYKISVKDNNYNEEAAIIENAVFKGEGTENNPYLIDSELDFTAVNRNNVNKDTIYKLIKNITIETSRVDQKDFVFNGKLFGNGRTITLLNSNSGAIYKLGEDGYIYNLNIAGSVTTALYDSIGTIVDYNNGKIEKVSVTANITSTGGTVGLNGLDKALNINLEDGAGNRGIAGGIVGTNENTGTIINCKIISTDSSTGTVKARIAGGCIAGLNYGNIESCISNACFGAWNSTESGGKSLSTYSYGGGIAGINAGTIKKCSIGQSGKLLAQRYTDDSLVTEGTNNAYLGGIAGLNMENASIRECSFGGIRVHGDECIGGIAGENAGSISDCYAEGIYNSSTKILSYIGGRKNVGGIVGKLASTGSVDNCFSTVNVYSFTVDTAYQIAEKATNSVYLSNNLNSKSVEGNPSYVSLKAPVGNGNSVVEVEKNSYDGQDENSRVKENYKLDNNYLSVINSNNKFFYSEESETIKLVYENEIIPEDTVSVELYKDGVLWKTIDVAETASTIVNPTKLGYKFTGWSVKLNSEIVFEAGSKISLYDLLDYQVNNEIVKLYSNFDKRIPNEGLIVAVWSKYIDNTDHPEASINIKNGFTEYLSQNNIASYDIVFRTYSSDSVADFGIAVNSDDDVDVIIGAGSNLKTQGGVEYISRAYMNYENLTSRYTYLLTDTDRALDFYSYITGVENSDAEVTFIVNGVNKVTTINSIFGNEADVPTVDVEESKEFKGWATTIDATEAVVLPNVKVTYSLVKNYLVDGKVSFYPVIVDKETKPHDNVTIEVAIWTNYISDEQADAILLGFKSYLVENGKDLEQLTINFTKYNQSKVADFGSAINAAKNVDIIVGNGSNITTSGGVATLEKANMTFDGITSRQCARLTDNTLAVLLYAYLTT